MENAADALKMAAAVLIFVMAISITINSFTETRVAATTILNNKDKEYDYSYVEDNGTTERLVSLESIIPTIYKAYKENYKIVFKENLFSDGVYKKINTETGTEDNVYSIDLQKEVLGNETQKEQFIMAILYGSKYDQYETVKNTFKKNLKISLNSAGIYDKINGKKLKESIGIYYQEEVGEQDNTNPTVPDANKTEKRVITYSGQ